LIKSKTNSKNPVLECLSPTSSRSG